MKTPSRRMMSRSNPFQLRKPKRRKIRIKRKKPNKIRTLLKKRKMHKK
jgi:hypothetical protein